MHQTDRHTGKSNTGNNGKDITFLCYADIFLYFFILFIPITVNGTIYILVSHPR